MCAAVNFAHIVHDCLNVNFPVQWIGTGGPVVWPLRSEVNTLDAFIWGYVKIQVYSQRVNTQYTVNSKH
jgi:hypothetical protein